MKKISVNGWMTSCFTGLFMCVLLPDIKTNQKLSSEQRCQTGNNYVALMTSKQTMMSRIDWSASLER